MEHFEKIKASYDDYVRGYRDEAGRLPSMMQLKYEHTMMVVRNAELIADGETFSSTERELSRIVALLHDTGRYEQLRRFNTFKDSESIDHAVFSHDIIRQRFNFSGDDWDAVCNAVLYHNRRDLPEGMDALTALLSHSVRDADKLDIFRVLEHQVRTTDWRGDSRAFWNLQVGVPPSAEVLSAIREHRPVDYQYIRSLADFVLIQIGWMISGLHFPTSRRLCSERGHLEFRRTFLRQIGGGQEADELCDVAEELTHCKNGLQSSSSPMVVKGP